MFKLFRKRHNETMYAIVHNGRGYVNNDLVSVHVREGNNLGVHEGRIISVGHRMMTLDCSSEFCTGVVYINHKDITDIKPLYPDKEEKE